MFHTGQELLFRNVVCTILMDRVDTVFSSSYLVD